MCLSRKLEALQVLVLFLIELLTLATATILGIFPPLIIDPQIPLAFLICQLPSQSLRVLFHRQIKHHLDPVMRPMSHFPKRSRSHCVSHINRSGSPSLCRQRYSQSLFHSSYPR